MNEHIDIILETISKDLSDKLPPGGGVESKYSFNFI
jgi:hypothetical protein